MWQTMFWQIMRRQASFHSRISFRACFVAHSLTVSRLTVHTLPINIIFQVYSKGAPDHCRRVAETCILGLPVSLQIFWWMLSFCSQSLVVMLWLGLIPTSTRWRGCKRRASLQSLSTRNDYKS
jgi:hypothetical protein